jgi:hypothetical protein
VEAALSALEHMSSLDRHIGHIAWRFRTGDVAEAQRGLVHLVRGIETLMIIAAMASQIAGLDLREIRDDDGRRVDTETGQAVDALIAHQMGADWRALATALEHQLRPALSAWQHVFQTLLGFPSDPGPLPCAA